MERISCAKPKMDRSEDKNQSYTSKFDSVSSSKTNYISGARNLLELKQKLGISTNQGVLNAFLDTKLEMITQGIYFPTKTNLNNDFPLTIEFASIQKMVSNWFTLRNLPFNNVTEMKVHFKKKDKTTLLEKVYRFLD